MIESQSVLSGEVARSRSLEVEPRGHAVSVLSRCAEMQTRLLELLRQRHRRCHNRRNPDTGGTPLGTMQQLPESTVRVIRQQHCALHDATSIRDHRISRRLTIANVAQWLQVLTSWVKRRLTASSACSAIRMTRFLLPIPPESIAALYELKSGVRNHLVIASRANR